MTQIQAENLRRDLIASGSTRTIGIGRLQPIVRAPVGLSGVEIVGCLDLSEVRFEDHVAFQGCHFTEGVLFSKAEFCKSVDFSGSHFASTAYFWRARFRDVARFNDVVVEPKGELVGSIDVGELNLSWAHFHGRAIFERARLHGPVRLWRTLFLNDVSMDEALFGSLTHLMGRTYDVSIDLAGLGGLATFETLEEQGLIERDNEERMSFDGREFTRFAQLRVTSEAELHARLEKTRIDATTRERIARVFREDSRPMFAIGRTVRLCGIEVAGPLKLDNVDMSPCLLLGTPMTSAAMSNVTWPRAHLLGGAVVRNKTADEDVSNDLSALRRLYVDLATAYELQQEDEAASRFRISAREMARRAQRGSTRVISTLYRYFAAYGEGRGVALFWLAAFVFVVFPTTFVLVDQPGPNSLARAVVRSLEVATFLNPDEANGTALAEAPKLALRVLMGVERVVVSSQVAFFLLALRRLFPR